MGTSSMMQFLVCLGMLSYVMGGTVGYIDRIQRGPKSFTIGVNLVLAQYPAGTAYNVVNPSDGAEVYTVFQKAFTDIGLQGGGIINIKPGTYITNRNLFVLKSKVHINGAGMDVTILKLADYAPSFIVNGQKKSGFLRTSQTSDFIVSNITLDGNKNNQYYDADSLYGRYGLFTEGCENVWFDRVKIINFQGYGFDPHGWKDGGVWGKYLTLTDCVAETNSLDGFTLDQTYYVAAIRNVARNNGRHGFNIVTGAKYVNLTGNIATYNGYYDPNGGSGCGYMIQNNQLLDTSDVSLDGNIETNSKKGGICLNDVYNINISNNIVGPACYCVQVTKTRSTVINQNVCNTKILLKITDSDVVYTLNANGVNPKVHVVNNVFNQLTKCLV